MKKAKVVKSITNTVMDTTIPLAMVGDKVYILEEHGNVFEVATEKDPSLTFYATSDQIEVIDECHH